MQYCRSLPQSCRVERLRISSAFLTSRAAIGLAQLEQADNFIARKIQVAKWYMEYL